MTTQNLLETTWGNLVPWEDYPQNDWPGGITGGGVPALYSQSRDRADGRFLPVYETEIDLSRQRAICRALGQLEGVGVGAIGSMTNYTVGTGMNVVVRAAQDQSPDAGLLAEIKAFVADFLKRNSVIGDLDREVDTFAREDGERLLTLNGNARDLSIGIIEPDWLTEPKMTRDLEEWLDCDFASTWSFGVHRHKGCVDPLGYHVLYEDSTDWDYFPVARCEHWKRNVPRTAARGVSDIYPVSQDLVRESKIAKNSAAGSAARAAIAWVEELVAGMTQSGAESSAISRALTRSTVTGDQTTTRIREMKPGTAVKVPNGKKYLAGPDGPATEGNLAVAQYLLRRFGVRWSAPEYLISGDASNGSFASTLVAESPFVKAREADQSGHGRRWASLLWKAIRIGYQAGLFSQWIPWEEIFRTIEIDCEFPDVASRNELQLTQAMVAQRDAGFISDRTASGRLGNDYDQEHQLGARRVAAPATSPFGRVPAMESFFLNRQGLLECGGKGGKPGPCPSQAETNAVADYSTDKFQKINGALRGSAEMTGDVRSDVANIDSFLEKSPKFEGTVFRKFPASEEIISQLQPGMTFTDKAFMSTSKDAPSFIPKGTVALQIVGNNGVDVSGVSLHGAAEKEVLFPRDSKFKVVKAMQHKQGGWVAILQEVGGVRESARTVIGSLLQQEWDAYP